jgi:tetratricopeptide (TPR) repeat protein
VLARIPLRSAALLLMLVPAVARADVKVDDYAEYAKLGRRYMAEEKWNLAVDQLEKAVAAKNDDDKVWTDLGDALAVDPRGVRFGSPTQNERAAAAYRRATQLNPGSGRAWNNLAWLRAKTKTGPDEALEAGKRAVELDEGRAGYLDTLAEVYYSRGEIGQAVDTADKARALEPSDEYLQKQYERFLAATSDPAPTPTPAAKKKTPAKATSKNTKKKGSPK